MNNGGSCCLAWAHPEHRHQLRADPTLGTPTRGTALAEALPAGFAAAPGVSRLQHARCGAAQHLQCVTSGEAVPRLTGHVGARLRAYVTSLHGVSARRPSSVLCVTARLHFVFARAERARPTELSSPRARQPVGPTRGVSRPFPMPAPAPGCWLPTRDTQLCSRSVRRPGRFRFLIKQHVVALQSQA